MEWWKQKLFLVFLPVLVLNINEGNGQTTRVIMDPASVTVTEGSTVTLGCKVENRGSKFVHWGFVDHATSLFLGTELQTRDDRFSVSPPVDSGPWWNLTIRDVRITDNGHYKCDVWNTAKFNSTFLQVTGATQPPTTIQAANVTDCCIAQGMRESCLPICAPGNTDPMQLVNLLLNDACYDTDLLILGTCAMGGRNSVACCLNKGVYINTCLSFCGDHTQPILLDNADDYYSCLPFMVDIISCVSMGLAYRPSPPTSVYAVPQNGRMIFIHWLPPEDYAQNLTNYKVFYRKSSETIYKSSDLLSTYPTYYTLRNLEADTQYFIYVIAINVYGSSMPSSTVEATAQDVVYATVTDHFNMTALQYIFGENCLRAHTSLNDIYEILPGLCALELNILIVNACCEQKNVLDICNRNLCSAEAMFQQLSADYLLQCYADLNNIFSCLAGLKNHSGCCQRYNVPDMCMSLCYGSIHGLQLQNFTQTLTCSIQMPVIVRCYQEGAETLPTPPTEVRINSIMSSYVDISWNAGDRAINYTVFYRIYKTGGSYMSKPVIGTGTVIYELQPNTTYEVFVVSVNNNGSSLQSGEVIFTTKVDYSTNPTVAPTPTFFNETACCKSKGITDPCLHMCDAKFRAQNYTQLTSLAITCSQIDNYIINKVLACATDGRNHSQCCQRKVEDPDINMDQNCVDICAMTNLTVLGLSHFSCINSFTEIEKCIMEGIVSIPRHPSNFVLKNITQSTAYLTWSPPVHGPTATGYRLRFALYTNSNPILLKWTVEETTQTFITLRNLKPDSPYLFDVFSINDNGSSVPSTVRGNTLPLEVPFNMSSGTFNWTNVWQNRSDCCNNAVMPDECREGCMTGDLSQHSNCLASAHTFVACAADGQNHRDCCSRKSVPSTCVLLCQGQTVAASANIALCYSWLPVIMSCFSEGYGLIPRPPRELTVTRYGSTSISLQWLPPLSCVSCTYVIMYGRSSDVFVLEKTGSDGQIEATIQQLAPLTSYTIVVRARNASGSSLPSSPVLATTTGDPLNDISVYILPSPVVDIGYRFKLVCNAFSSPPPVSVNWYFNTRMVSGVNEYSVTSATKNDAGVYSCVTNFENDVKKKNLTVSIRYKPDPTSFKDVFVEPGIKKQAVLECHFKGFPDNITWSSSVTTTATIYNDTLKYTPLSRIRVDTKTGITSSTLTIRAVVEKDYGSYTCLGNNRFGNKSITGNLKNTFEEPPVPTRPPGVTVNQCCLNGGVTKLCADAICSWDIDIYKVIQNISLLSCLQYFDQFVGCATDGRSHRQCCEKRGISEYCLPFCDAVVPTYQDSSELEQCLLHTTDIFECLETGLENIPSRPRSMTATQNYHTIDISWKPPAKNAEKIDKYEIFYTLNGSSQVNTAIASKKSVQYHLGPLQKGRYMFWMRAVTNVYGYSQNTTNMLIVNVNKLVPGPPLQVDVNVVSTNNFRITWKTPADSYIQVTMYKVKYRALPDGKLMIAEVAGTDTTVRIQGLKYGTYYNITVVAVNNDGEGKPTPVITKATESPTVVAQPPKPEGRTQGETGAIVGGVLGVIFVVALVVVGFFVYRRFLYNRTGKAVKEEVAFENPSYHNRERISGLPGDNMQPESQFKYMNLSEEREAPENQYDKLGTEKGAGIGGEATVYDNKGAVFDDNPAMLKLEDQSTYDNAKI